jgi:hypothetical protein
MVYILGAHLSDKNSHVASANIHQVLLRIPAAALANLSFSELELLVLSPSSIVPSWRRWSSELSPSALFSPVVTEASLLRQHGTWMVVSLHFEEIYIRICESKNDAISWECRYIAEIDTRWQHGSMITYAAKAHPELASCPGYTNSSGLDLVVSFVSNSLMGPDELFEPEFHKIYTPKFMRITEIK